MLSIFLVIMLLALGIRSARLQLAVPRLAALSLIAALFMIIFHFVVGLLVARPFYDASAFTVITTILFVTVCVIFVFIQAAAEILLPLFEFKEFYTDLFLALTGVFFPERIASRPGLSRKFSSSSLINRNYPLSPIGTPTNARERQMVGPFYLMTKGEVLQAISKSFRLEFVQKANSYGRLFIRKSNKASVFRTRRLVLPMSMESLALKFQSILRCGRIDYNHTPVGCFFFDFNKTDLACVIFPLRKHYHLQFGSDRLKTRHEVMITILLRSITTIAQFTAHSLTDPSLSKIYRGSTSQTFVLEPITPPSGSVEAHWRKSIFGFATLEQIKGRISIQFLALFIGFVDGDGTLSHGPQNYIAIGLHERDLPLLIYFKNILGIGDIFPRAGNQYVYRLPGFSLNMLIIPLRQHYGITFLTNTRRAQMSGLLAKWGKVTPLPLLATDLILNYDWFKYWLIGFIRAEGCFSKYSSHETHAFKLAQKGDHLTLFGAIKAVRGLAHGKTSLSQRSGRTSISFESKKDVQTVVNFFVLEAPYRTGYKAIQFKVWVESLAQTSRYSQVVIPELTSLDQAIKSLPNPDSILAQRASKKEPKL